MLRETSDPGLPSADAGGRVGARDGGDESLQWIARLTPLSVARNAVVLGLVGLATGWLVCSMPLWVWLPLWPLILPLLCLGSLIALSRLLCRAHQNHRSADAIRAAAIETSAWVIGLVVVPWWMGINPLLAAGFAALFWMAWNARMIRQFWNQDEHLRSPATCLVCGSSLVGVSGLQCPECGYVFHEEEIGLERRDLLVSSKHGLPEQPRF